MCLELPEALQHVLALADDFIHAPTRRRVNAIIARTIGAGDDFTALLGEGDIFGGQRIMRGEDEF